MTNRQYIQCWCRPAVQSGHRVCCVTAEDAVQPQVQICMYEGVSRKVVMVSSQLGGNNVILSTKLRCSWRYRKST